MAGTRSPAVPVRVATGFADHLCHDHRLRAAQPSGLTRVRTQGAVGTAAEALPPWLGTRRSTAESPGRTRAQGSGVLRPADSPMSATRLLPCVWPDPRALERRRRGGSQQVVWLVGTASCSTSGPRATHPPPPARTIRDAHLHARDRSPARRTDRRGAQPRHRRGPRTRLRDPPLQRRRPGRAAGRHRRRRRRPGPLGHPDRRRGARCGQAAQGRRPRRRRARQRRRQGRDAERRHGRQRARPPTSSAPPSSRSP